MTPARASVDRRTAGELARGESSDAPMVFFETPSHHFLRDRWFDSGTVPTGGDDLQAPWRHVRAALAAGGIAAHTADLMDEVTGARTPKLLVSVSGQGDHAALSRRPDVILSAYIALECPAVEPSIYRRLPEVARRFRRVLSWTDGEHLLPFTRRLVKTERFCWPQSYSRVHPGFWEREDRRFLVMINSNKLPRLYANELYTKRLEAVEYFHRFGEVDLYGPNWDRMPSRVGKSIVPVGVRFHYRKSGLEELVWRVRQRVAPNRLYVAAASAWKGVAKSKADTLSSYRFALCFENQALNGWMTEKLFDCLFAGTVPIYWGAPDVTDFVPRECFIDMRDFADFAELRDYLRALPAAEVGRFREAGRAWVESAAFAPFRMETFSAMLTRIVTEDIGRLS